MEENREGYVPVGDEGQGPGGGGDTASGARPGNVPPPDLTKPGTVLRIEDFGKNRVPGPPGSKRKPRPAKPKPPPSTEAGAAEASADVQLPA
jgi:hypothetical protein